MAKTVLAYSFLKATYGASTRNPVDSVIPLVKRALREVKAGEIDQHKLQRVIRRIFGLEIPLNVIRYTFPHLAKQGAIELRKPSFRYHLIGAKFQDAKILEIEEEGRKQYQRLLAKVRSISSDHGIEGFRAEDVLEDWLDSSSLSFLGGNNPAYAAGNDEREINRIVAIALTDPTFAKDLSDVAIGDALYRAIKEITEYAVEVKPEKAASEDDQIKDAIAIYSSAMKGVALFFDTRFVLRILGYVADELSKAATELISLARQLDAKTCVFRHNLEEIQRIFDSVAINLQHNLGEGEIASYAFEHGLLPADLIELGMELEKNCQRVGIEVIDAPELTTQLSINERQLDSQLEVDLRQSYERARQTDVDSLAAIYRLRKGEPKRFLEKCDALFVTTNKSLADSSVRYFRQFFKELGKANRVQLCMTDVVLATRLWTKLPTSYDKLPRQQIVAHALSSLRPNQILLDKFRSHLQSFVTEDKISDEQAARVKLSTFASKILALEHSPRDVDLSKDEALSVTMRVIAQQDKVLEAIKRNSEEDREDAERGLAEAHGRLAELERNIQISDGVVQKKLRQIEDRDHQLEALRISEANVRARVSKLASVATKLAVFVIVAVLIWSLMSSFGPIGDDNSTAMSALHAIVVFILSLLTTFGLGVFSLGKKLEDFMVKKAIEFFFE